ncbi:EpsG family protein [Pedobacter lusitanus]|uniref:EpsG family protein n=1 Tax=Pedobacter lusitanus TaxID=1503925 RepID=UPI0009E457C8|nr:EpsG family protein [Pedobacter lusitanus]
MYRDFTQIRYGLSCSIVYWAIYFFTKKRYFAFAFSFVLAFLLHNTALIIIILLPLCYFFKNRYVYLIAPFVCLIGLFINPFPILLSLGGVPEHMQIYFNEEGGGGMVVSVIGMAIMMIYAVFYTKVKSENFDFDMYYRLLAVGVSLNLLFIQASIFQRFSYLFFQFCVLFLPNMLAELQKMKDKYYFVLLHFLFNCFFVYYGIKLIAPTLIRPYF